MAELFHTRQVAQQTADLEAERVAALAKMAKNEAKKEQEATAKEALLQHQRQLEKLQEHKHPSASAAATTLATVAKSIRDSGNNIGNNFFGTGSGPTTGQLVPVSFPAALSRVVLN